MLRSFTFLAAAILLALSATLAAPPRAVVNFFSPAIGPRIKLPDASWSWQRDHNGKPFLVYSGNGDDVAGDHTLTVRLADIDPRLAKALATAPSCITVTFGGNFDAVGITGAGEPRLLTPDMPELKDKKRPLTGSVEVSLFRKGDREQIFLHGEHVLDFELPAKAELSSVALTIHFAPGVVATRSMINAFKIEY